MLKLGAIRGDDYLIDLGSGDGRIPITAAQRFGARGFGVDIKPELVKLANENAAKAGVADKVRFERRDLFETSLADATVVTLYLLPGIVTQARAEDLRRDEARRAGRVARLPARAVDAGPLRAVRRAREGGDQRHHAHGAVPVHRPGPRSAASGGSSCRRASRSSRRGSR